MGDKIKVIMDCDPGIDDGIALAYAAAHQDELELLAVTTSAGSTRIDKSDQKCTGAGGFLRTEGSGGRRPGPSSCESGNLCGRIPRRDRAWPLRTAGSKIRGCF